MIRFARFGFTGSRLAVIVGLTLSVAGGCSEDFVPRSVVCHTGDTRECLGPGACKGAQECSLNEQGFDPCQCGDATEANGGGGQGSGASGEGGNGEGGADAMTTGGTPTDTGGTPGSAGSNEPTVEGGGGQGGAGEPDYECTPVGNVGCSATQNCDPANGELHCVDAGAKAELTACQTTGDCAAGLMCLQSNCVKACVRTADCQSADPSIKCGLGFTHPQLGPLSACVTACDILTQNCPAGQACYLGSCLAVISPGAAGAECEEVSQCAKGSQCLLGEGCSKYCSTVTQNPCAQGMSCFKLADEFPQLPATWGVCTADQ